jgi:hypothetical protein
MINERRFVFTVTGSGEFPKAMLEYDGATALTPADQTIIDATYDDSVLWDTETKHLRLNSVQLITTSRFAPTRARWASFTWKVTDGPNRHIT